MLTRRHLLATAAGAGAARLAGPALADYPDHVIRILCGYAAGGGVDIVARLLSDPLKSTLNQTVIVEDRPGASAMIASNAVAKATPDGYTPLAAASGEVAINQFLFKEKMTYDPAKELAPLALVGIVPCVVVVAATTPVHNPRELIAYAKANPGKLTFSSSGVGNPQQLVGELMNSMAGTSVLHVPYRGPAPAVTDVAVGAVTMSFSSLAAALPLIQDRKLRAVAVASRERMPQLPEVAPLSEGLGGAQRLRVAQLVWPVRDRRRAGADRRAPQRHRQRRAQGQGHRRQADAAGHRAQANGRRRVHGFRGLRAGEVRQGGRGRQH
jgi:tripartite-type tricarboxylate transporter receptor subunit TctC